MVDNGNESYGDSKNNWEFNFKISLLSNLSGFKLPTKQKISARYIAITSRHDCDLNGKKKEAVKTVSNVIIMEEILLLPVIKKIKYWKQSWILTQDFETFL